MRAGGKRRAGAGAALIVAALLLAAPAAAAPLGKGLERSVVVEFSGEGHDDVYLVPAGEALVITDILAMHEGNADGLLRVRADERVVAIVPIVGMVSATDIYGLHLITGLRFEAGQRISLRKDVPGPAWVTLVGYAVRG